MRDRCRAPAAVFVAALALIPVACQAPSSPTAVDTDTSLRTPWGEPDLQGIWTDTTATPLERPAQFAGQEFFTDEERAELDEQRAALRRFDTRSEAGTPLDVAGAYNAVYQSVKKTGRRTSLIVGCFRHQLLLPRPYLVLTKPLRLDIQCQRGASVKIGWKYLDD